MCMFVFSMLSNTVSSGVMNIKTDDQRYNKMVSESRVRNINGRAMLQDSSVIWIPGLDTTNLSLVQKGKTRYIKI